MIKNKIKKNYVEGVGFFFEVLFFFMSGFLFWISPVISIALFTIGLVIAIMVGKEIKRKALQK